MLIFLNEMKLPETKTRPRFEDGLNLNLAFSGDVKIPVSSKRLL